MDIQDGNLLSACAKRLLDIADSLAQAKVRTRKTLQDANDLKILTGLLISEIKKLPEMK